jgi:hypothetical protein
MVDNESLDGRFCGLIHLPFYGSLVFGRFFCVVDHDDLYWALG